MLIFIFSCRFDKKKCNNIYIWTDAHAYASIPCALEILARCFCIVLTFHISSRYYKEYTSCTLTKPLWKLTTNRYDVIYNSGYLVMYWMHQTTAGVRYYTAESNAHTFLWHTRVTSHFMVIWLPVLNEHWLLLWSQNCPVLANITWSIDKNSSALVIIKRYIYTHKIRTNSKKQNTSSSSNTDTKNEEGSGSRLCSLRSRSKPCIVSNKQQHELVGDFGRWRSRRLGFEQTRGEKPTTGRHQWLSSAELFWWRFQGSLLWRTFWGRFWWWFWWWFWWSTVVRIQKERNL